LRSLDLGTLALGAAAGLQAACGPIEYVSQVTVRASTALAAAEQAGAAQYAPYEMTAARAYLDPAREEAGYAEYQSAIELGREAEDLAIRARAIAGEKKRPDVSPSRPPAAPMRPRPASGKAAGSGAEPQQAPGAPARRDDVPYGEGHDPSPGRPSIEVPAESSAPEGARPDGPR
jgi:hypothetical protein